MGVQADKELPVFVYVGDKLMGPGPAQQTTRNCWVLLPFCRAMSLTSLVTTVNSKGAVDRPNGSVLN